MDLFMTDVDRCVSVLEQHITSTEQDLIQNHQGGDTRQWTDLNEYKKTLNNLKLLKAIYG